MSDEVVEHVAQKVLDEHLFSDGVNASQVAAELEAMLLSSVVGRCTLKDTVARPINTATSKPPPV